MGVELLGPRPKIYTLKSIYFKAEQVNFFD